MRGREVDLQGVAAGRLFLHSMPGRYEPLGDFWSEVERKEVRVIVCLAPPDEIQKKSPDYAAAIEAKEVPCALRAFPVADFGGPENEDGFRELAEGVAASLRAGESLLIHCGAGIGRTGMVAIAALMVLGLPHGEAEGRVRAAGSGPEVREQVEALDRLAEDLRTP